MEEVYFISVHEDRKVLTSAPSRWKAAKLYLHNCVTACRLQLWLFLCQYFVQFISSTTIVVFANYVYIVCLVYLHVWLNIYSALLEQFGLVCTCNLWPSTCASHPLQRVKCAVRVNIILMQSDQLMQPQGVKKYRFSSS